ncbi:MAG TPA: DUF927 domain-containing protein [Syntrophomonadaceae bacterium]|nr:DUF927 domain-containing protein [Thermoanaerobacterales bacterium]HHW29933.1 DUF927 domain-containing protein [Syntrophomonadaceae bacterium]
MAAVVKFPGILEEKERLLAFTPYAIRNGALCYEKICNDEVVTEKLCNFVAWQEEKRIIDDGSGELQQQFLMRGQTETNKKLPDVEIPASQFAGLSWIAANWSPRAIIRAGYKNKDQLREAIELLSQDIIERHIYTHTGWRQINGQWCFLHGGGAVGLDEPVEVMLAEELKRYILPDKTENIDEALQASLRTLNVGKKEVTYPLFAATFRAVLAEFLYPDFTLFLWGPTGKFKSTIAALFLSHFGRFTTQTLPTGWTTSDNALEKLAFLAKDIPLVVDDFAPEKDRNINRQLERKANRLIRTTANRTGRARLRSDLTTVPGYVPRCLTMITGEQLPNSIQSIQARYLAVRFEEGSVDVDKLTAAQNESYFYPHTMRAFIEWLLPQTNKLQDELTQTFLELRDKARDNGHRRLAETVANLQIGIIFALRFFYDMGAINEQQLNDHLEQSWSVFCELAEEQARIIEQERPSVQFVAALQALLVQKKVHLACFHTGKEPDTPDEFGWEMSFDIGSPDKPGYIRYGDFIGWVDEDYLYLQPEIVYKAVVEFYRNSSGFTVSQRGLREQLYQEGLLVREHGRYAVSEYIPAKGKKIRVLKLHRNKTFSLLSETGTTGTKEEKQPKKLITSSV